MSMKHDVLEDHGTDVGGLTPGSIVSAAEVDMQRERRNQRRGFGNGNEFYSFHRKHVHRATTVRQLIKLAIDEPEIGRASGKKSTRIIYRDETLLWKALRHLESNE